ncbi:MAG: hypothetical protein Hyperionvirus11_41 [Hyperionvirus sp.]|uniref:Uncharacterized protein n=1 Tax=Hyperionvirus sp. TaxID=2487770 RepID=A0A3G5A938_9VIRU|nr:MAG: hypothetical protein Hyperionvirus11_41 [Hyperionvirus sp.]
MSKRLLDPIYSVERCFTSPSAGRHSKGVHGRG